MKHIQGQLLHTKLQKNLVLEEAAAADQGSPSSSQSTLLVCLGKKKKKNFSIFQTPHL